MKNDNTHYGDQDDNLGINDIENDGSVMLRDARADDDEMIIDQEPSTRGGYDSGGGGDSILSRLRSLPNSKRIAVASILMFGAVAMYYILSGNSDSDKEKIAANDPSKQQINLDQLTQSIAQSMGGKQGKQQANHDGLDFIDSPPKINNSDNLASISNIHDINVPTVTPQRPLRDERVSQINSSPPLPPSPLKISNNSNEPEIKTNIMSKISSSDDKQKEAERARLQSNIFVFGGGSSSENEKKEPEDTSNVDIFNDDGDNILQNSGSPKVVAQVVRNLDRTILEGKIIDAVLETALNTSVQSGLIRAIVSRDVYSEQSKNILVPKGARLIGTYKANVKSGQSRVEIVWSRLITPAGIDVKIDSKSSDSLGRPGINGFTDTKWLSKLANAFLVSYVVPYASAAAMDALDQQTVTSTTTGTSPVNGGGIIPNGGSNGANNIPSTVTTTASVKAQIAQNAMQSFQQTANQVIKDHFSDDTVVVVEQGQKIKIFVMKDLVFARQAIANNQNGVLMD